MAPSRARRWALVLLHSLVPYALHSAPAPASWAEDENEEVAAFAPGQPHRLQTSTPEPGELLHGQLGGTLGVPAAAAAALDRVCAAFVCVITVSAPLSCPQLYIEAH